MSSADSAESADPAEAVEVVEQNARIWATLRDSPLVVRALLAGILVNRLGRFMVVYLVLFLTHRGFSAVQAGAALGGYGFGGVAGVLVGTALADWLGARRATILSMAGTAVLVVSVLYLRNFPAMLVVVALAGMIGQVYRPASLALLSELTPKDRQVMIFALYRMCMNLGTTVAPLFGAALILVSYSLLFWGEAVAALGYAVIALIALPRRTVHLGDDARQRKVSNLSEVIADRRYLLFLIALLINGTVYIQYVSVLPLAMRAGHLATVWYAFVISMNAAIVITCELLMTKLTQRWPARVVALIGFALLGVGQAMYSIPGGLVIFIGGTLVWTLAEITAGPTMSAYPANAGPARLRGQYLGASQAMFSLGFAIGPILGVLAWHLIGKQVWYWCAAACVVGLALAWRGMAPAASESEPDPVTAAAQS